MKKIIICLLLIVSLCGMFCGCSSQKQCSHDWVPVDGTSNVFHCAKCKNVKVETSPVIPCNHDWHLIFGDNVFQCNNCLQVNVTENAPCAQHVWLLQRQQLSGAVGVVKQYLCAACGSSYSEKVKNIVLIIGDGMGMEHISAGQLAADRKFCFSDWPFASVNTNSLADTGFATKTTDSAAAATALATGTLTTNGYVAKNSQGQDLTTILDVAKQYGMKTGIVSTDKLYGATPAAFSAHSPDRNSTAEIIQSQIVSNVDLLCATSSGTVSSYKKQMADNGYQFCNNFDNRQQLNKDKAVCLFDLEGFGNSVKLKDAATFALDFLDNENGFVLVVEQAHVDKHSHSNNFSQMVDAVNSLNGTVEAILSKTKGDTAILITADHETGGLCVSATPTLSQTYISPNGNINPVYYDWKSTSHTNSNVGLFYYGFSANLSVLPYYHNEKVIKNTDIFVLMQNILQQIHSNN